jgi:hypothetical protein
MIKKILTDKVLKTFFAIPLSSKERQIAIESVDLKYVPAIQNSIIYSLLCLPAILVLDMGIVVAVLTPVTMVSGTAWFAVSLANMKKKFETFGTELTVDLFESFVISLLLLLMIAIVAVNPVIFGFVSSYGDNDLVKLVAGIFAALVVVRISLKILLGALKYDMNDAMLTGQAEAAQKYYTKSLSFFHQSAAALKSGKSLEVANYHIANSFFELFSYVKNKIKTKRISASTIDNLIKTAAEMKRTPNSDQKKIDKMSIQLIESFLVICSGVEDDEAKKSLANIKLELESIKDDKSTESQEMVDTRFASIFQEIAELIEEQGEMLFDDENIKDKDSA